jgi:hypothetical protein
MIYDDRPLGANVTGVTQAGSFRLLDVEHLFAECPAGCEVYAYSPRLARAIHLSDVDDARMLFFGLSMVVQDGQDVEMLYVTAKRHDQNRTTDQD